ncbi:MAG: Mobile element protein [Bryobacterales bacterium]|nr:Mobile element protein [Bryobacterales bacterium]
MSRLWSAVHVPPQQLPATLERPPDTRASGEIESARRTLALRQSGCERRIFCQRLKDVTHKHARETKRFGEAAQLIAYALGGRPGERLSHRLGFPVSNDTLLRRVKQMAQLRPPSGPIPVVGVDEWAWRKGYGRYGTILVDLKRRKVADLLPECSAVALEQWLRQHQEIKIISRDRQGSLAEVGRRGAPAAKQVADRFHLIQNLQQAVLGELARQRPHLMIPAGEFMGQMETEKVAPAAAELVISKPRKERCNPTQKEARQQRRQQKVESFQMVKSLRAQGLKVSDIVRQTGICRGLVDKWLRLEECPPQNKKAPRPGMAEDFREELWRQWEQGHQEGKQLFAEIRKRGYVGSYASLMRFLAPWREERGAAGQASRPGAPIHPGAVRHISPRAAVALMSKPKPELNSKQREMVEILKRRCPGFAMMRHLVLSFRSIVCGGKASSLKRWAEKAEATGFEAIRSFARQLKKDWAAVQNAVKQVWSNGPVEGHINRFKTLKRQMYGRAKSELLRARTLPLAA